LSCAAFASSAFASAPFGGFGRTLSPVFWQLFWAAGFWPRACPPPSRRPSRPRRSSDPSGTGVTAEHARRRELAELVPDHRLADEHGDMFLPSCTAIVWPTISGKIVERARPSSKHFLVVRGCSALRCDSSSALHHGPFLLQRLIVCLPFPRRLPRTMYASELLFFLRVRYPSVGTPHGGPRGASGSRSEAPRPRRAGGRPGFIAVPRVCGRTPCGACDRPLPIFTFWCSAFGRACRRFARHSARTMRISPYGRRSVAISPSLAISWTAAPAERAIWPPRPGCSSRCGSTVPTGMRESDMQLPTEMSAVSPEATVMPTVSRCGARM